MLPKLSIDGPVVVHWFRRDLRLHDNAALSQAQQSGYQVLPLFIFDREILDKLPSLDRRVIFIHRTLSALKASFRTLGSDLLICYGRPADIWPELLASYLIQAVHANQDYEPYALERDGWLAKLLQTKGLSLSLHKDHVIFHQDEVLSGSGMPYKVFTPYKNAWLARLSTNSGYLKPHPTEDGPAVWAAFKDDAPMPTLAEMGFKDEAFDFPAAEVPTSLMKAYADARNYPARPGTSRVGIHLRFGTVSIRQLAARALEHGETFLSELIWRDFYQMILSHFPQVVGHAFKPEYDRIPWRDSSVYLQRWQDGQTGYPIVDAGMRELNETGYMHNRVRMVVASFLTKHLLLDWRLGEAYFAEKLLDFELASNNGGWQWAAGTGVDAAPYFRIFNPSEQTRKFDPDLRYVRQWVPEFESFGYPKPMVDHKLARERALQVYKSALLPS
jgi:deoxyribodipyrimidine photo-lyase